MKCKMCTDTWHLAILESKTTNMADVRTGQRQDAWQYVLTLTFFFKQQVMFCFLWLRLIFICPGSIIILDCHILPFTIFITSFMFKYSVDRKVIRIETAMFEWYLSYDVASGSEITPCNKICKPLVVYRFTGNVMKSITMLRKWQNCNVFYA